MRPDPQKLSYVGLVLLVLLSIFLFDPIGILDDLYEFPKLMALIVGSTIISILNLYTYFSENKKIEIPKNFAIAICIFFIGQLVGYIFSINKINSFIGTGFRFQGFLTNIYYIILLLNAIYLFSNKKFFDKILPTIGIFGAIESALALIPYDIFDKALFYDRVFGTFGNPNYLASFLVVAIPCQLLIKNKWLQIISLAISSYALILTGSRSAWLALIIAAGILGLIELIKSKKKYLLYITTILILLLVSTIFVATKYDIPALERFSVEKTNLKSWETRRYLWGAGIQLFLEKPITGYGQDTTAEIIGNKLPEYLNGNEIFFVDRVHSEPIEIAITTGIAGLIGYLLMLLISLLNAAKNVKDKTTLIAIGCIIAISLYHFVNFSTITSNVILMLLYALTNTKTKSRPT